MAKIAGTPSVIKQANMLLIRETIQKTPMVSKPQIAKSTSLSLVTVSKIVDELEHSGEVTAVGFQESTGGRKAKQYVIDTSFSAVITVLVRSGRYYVYLRDIGGNLLCGYTRDHGALHWTEELFSVLAQARERAESNVCAIGVAVPGTVSDGVVRNIPLIPEWEGADLGRAVEERFGVAAVIENDINASTIGTHEDYGNAEVRNMLFLYLDDGIGAGVVIGNKLYKTRRNFVGELGFMDIGRWDGRKGGERSLEALVKGLIGQDRREDVADIVARLLINTCCVIDPDLVVIDSGYLRREDVALIRERFVALLGAGYAPEIVVTQVDNEMYSRGLFSLCRSSAHQTIHISN